MAAPFPEPNVIWRVRLFDGPFLEDPSGNTIRRFRSKRAGTLLAYLALHLGEPVAREELFEAIWPEEDVVAVANRFRFTLSTLRKQVEPPGVPFGMVLDVSEPGRVRLRAEAVWCDVSAFERALHAKRLAEAARLARGTFLPGYYDEWVIIERERLEALREDFVPAYSCPPSPIHEDSPGESPSAPQYRLPLYLTRFFGRVSEGESLARLIADHRLVTIVGPGGTGKTRLAVETTKALALTPIFVALADLKDPSGVPEVVLRSLNIAPPGAADAIDHLTAVLQQRNGLLLILDNAEHLIDAVASLSIQLLEAVPELRLLITSRHRMGIAGEAVLALEPLELPAHAAALERLLEFPAFALFVDRARNARPDFVVSLSQIESVLRICRRLEGMPLALELAAGHVSYQSLSRIAQVLDTNLTDLAYHQRGSLPRHRSLRAAIQGSYDLLSDEAKAFYIRLSVFQGGWSASAATAVTGSEKTEELLGDLVVRSLVVAREDETTGVMRYSFLESLRQFAAEELVNAEQTSGGTQDPATSAPGTLELDTARRHANYYLGLAEKCTPEIEAQGTSITLAELDGEVENLRAALQWALDTHEFELAHRLTRSLGDFWAIRGYLFDGRNWNELLLKSWEAAPIHALAEIHLMCGVFAVHQNEIAAAKQHLNLSLELYQTTGNRKGILKVTLALGNAYRMDGEHLQAVDLYTGGIALCNDLDDDNELAKCHHGLGISSLYLGRHDEARVHLGRALDIRLRQSRVLDVARTQNLLAFSLMEMGDMDAAKHMFLACLSVFSEYGERWYYSSTRYGLGVISYMQGDMDAARADLEICLAIVRDIRSPESEADCLGALGCIYARLGLAEQARQSVVEGLHLARRIRNTQSIASLLWAVAVVMESQSQYEASATVLSASTTILSQLSVVIFCLGRLAIQNLKERLLEILGASAYESAARTGSLLDSEDAVNLALYALDSAQAKTSPGRSDHVVKGDSTTRREPYTQ